MTGPTNGHEPLDEFDIAEPMTSSQQAVDALLSGSVRIGCLRGAALHDVAPAALIGIVRRILDLERRPVVAPPLTEA